ncbi:formate dehydrogenase accessory sulfurtransferase FdhD [Bremerella alba]|uniref:Sulfur carrier protein FdhD n=1 Tax=Bremerella alba TaxID=980252 RepID=A0A7V9A859_9BACT|nr:formate dehydrogenase accessory sulfurtransferase FdhD [Bremerella alba]MBA2116077.1 Sulfur carrier protein FdhD [Bremerella alba]
MPSSHSSVVELPVTFVSQQERTQDDDEVCIEEPLEIRLAFISDGQVFEKPLAVTMRTPGSDRDLATGFLLSEGIIYARADLSSIEQLRRNVVVATLAPHAQIDWPKLQRHSYVSSSCGVCGKRSIAAVFQTGVHRLTEGTPRLRSELIHHLSNTQRRQQTTFHRTGGLHAAALFDPEGRLVANFEDVGRHNALDKLIGRQLLENRLPLNDKLLLLSGRACFELIQKASMAGIPVVASVGAPTSLAVSLARDMGITLLGFVRDSRFNIYSDFGRLIEGTEESE